MTTINFTPINLSIAETSMKAVICNKAAETMGMSLDRFPRATLLAIKITTLMAIAPKEIAKVFRELVDPLYGKNWLEVRTLADELEMGMISHQTLGDPVFLTKFQSVMDAAFEELQHHHNCGEADLVDALLCVV